MKRLACLLVAMLAAMLVQPARTAAPAPRPLDIYFIDVEGGAATLIVTPSGESILTDCGWPREDGRDAKRIEHVARYVAGLSQIDHCLITHWHTDHYGGIEQLARLMPVKRYWDRGIPEKASDGAGDFPMLIEAYRRANGGRSTALQPGDTIPLRPTEGRLELKIVSSGGKVLGEGDAELPTHCDRHPPAPVQDESDNKLSLGMLLTHRRFQFLNLGDLTWNIEHKLACPKNRIGVVDLWQVTHHGAAQSGNPALVQAIQPRVAVITNGPKKGGAAQTFATLKRTPSVQAVYQIHRNVTTRAEDNTTPERIANLQEDCRARYIRARLSPRGDRYTVTVGDRGLSEEFSVR